MYCPHCQKPLSDPPESFCPHCGDAIQEPPALGSARSAAGATPWENRERIGWLSGLIETTRQVLFSPGEFFRSMPTVGGIGAPLGYGVLAGYAGLVLASLYQLVFQSVFASWAGRFGQGHTPFERWLPMMGQGLGFALQLVLGPLFVLIGIFIASAILHVFLLLFGGAQRGFEASFRVMCYSEATAFAQVIPMCGGFVTAVWWIVVTIIGLSEAHATGKGQAAAAVLVPIVLVCCCCIGALALMAGGIAGLAGRLE